MHTITLPFTHRSVASRALRVWTTGFVLLLLGGCGGGDSADPTPVAPTPRPDALTTVTLSPANPTLVAASSLTFTPTATVGGSSVTVSYRYSTSAPQIATVTDAGVLTAVNAGTATITVTATGSGSGFTTASRQATTVITVTPQPALSALVVSPDSVALVVGANAYQIMPVATTPEASIRVLYAYTSSATAVATVSTGGLVTAVSAGAATITVTATASESGFATTMLSKTVAVSVVEVPFVLGVGFADAQFALVPSGTFTMGSTSGRANERPVRLVTISTPLFMQKTEVTQTQWREIMRGTARENPSGFSGCGNTCPVDNVSWDEVQEFLQRLNARDTGKQYRLPTEAEWEYAARAGTTGDFGGNGVLLDMGWSLDNADRRPHPVAQKLANAWGLFDMHGNVWEWVHDWYAAVHDSGATPSDPTGPATGTTRVMRGGSHSSDTNSARSAYRTFSTPAVGNQALGFRLVRTS